MQPKREHMMTDVIGNGLWSMPGRIKWGDDANEVNWVARITPGPDGKEKRDFWPRPRMKSAVTGKMVPDNSGKKPLVFVPSEVLESERWYSIEVGNDSWNGRDRVRRRGYFVARILGDFLLTITAIGATDAMSLAQRLNAGEIPDDIVIPKETPAPAGDADSHTEPAEETGEGDEMETSDILGMLTGLEQAVCEEDWGGAEYLSEQIMRAVGTRKRAAAVKARREQLEREKEWASAHPGAGTT